MKTKIINRILIFLACNIHIIVAIIFAASFMITVLSHIIFSEIRLLVGYIFWFCFGLYVFSVTYIKANAFLAKKYEEKNEYYLGLLDKRRKRTKKTS